jgi:hypothetical protein
MRINPAGNIIYVTVAFRPALRPTQSLIQRKLTAHFNLNLVLRFQLPEGNNSDV